MKTLLSIALITVVFILPSCKKASVDPNSPEARTGLAALTDKSSDNYIVAIIHAKDAATDDTIIIQTSQGDSNKLSTTIIPYNIGPAPVLKNEFVIKKRTNRYESIGLSFYQFQKDGTPTLNCSWLDTLVRYVPFDVHEITGYNAPAVGVYIADSYWGGDPSNTLNYHGEVCNIESITKTATAGGCQKARVRGTFASAVELKNLPCGQYASYTIKGGAFQLDFTIQP